MTRLADPYISALRAPALPAALLAVLAWAVWGHLEGGFSATRWGSFGAGLLALVAVTVLALHRRIDLSERARVVALGALGLFCAWNFLSILWADFPGDAWAAADVTLVYAAGFALFSLWRFSGPSAALVLGAFVLGVVVVGAVALANAVDDPVAAFVDGRLLTPVGYPNGTAALWMSAAWPAVFLAGDRRIPAALRGVSLGACTFLVELAVLGQSRAWALFVPALVALALLLTRQRLRLALGVLLVAASTGAATPYLLRVHRSLVSSHADAAVDRAATAIAITSAAACLAGVLWSLAEGRIRIDARARLALSVALVVLCLAGVAGGAGAFFTEVDHPGAWISARWHEFTEGKSLEVSGSRFTASASSGRYQEWRIAWKEFVAHPATGIGADNFAAAYVKHRTDDFREPRFPHSLELRLLSQLGVVGTALFATFAVSATILVLRRRRRLGPADGSIVAAAAMVFLSWLVSGSVDWFWEIPALAAPALAFLGLAGAVSLDGSSAVRPVPPPAPAERTPDVLAVPVLDRKPDPAEPDEEQPDEKVEPEPGAVRAPGPGEHEAPRRRVPFLAKLVGVTLASTALAAGLVSIALPALSQSYEDAGVAGWPRDPARAYARLERAADLDPLSGAPLLVEGSIALRLGDTERARSALERVLEREPENWYANLQLALLYGSLGQRPLATAYLARAKSLNPNDKVARRLATLLERGKPVDPNALNDRYRSAFDRRLTASSGPPASP